MHRDQADFVVDGEDNLLHAINDTRSLAQQAYNFGMLLRRAYAVVDADGINWRTDCTDVPGGTSIKLKLIESTWLHDASSPFKETYRIDMPGRSAVRFNTPERSDADVYSAGESYSNQQVYAYIVGQTLRVNNQSSMSMCVWGTEILPDLTPSDTEDYFVTNYSNWLLLATIQNLNFYLKEDQRVAISDGAVQRHWNSMTEDDGQAAASGDVLTLD